MPLSVWLQILLKLLFESVRICHLLTVVKNSYHASTQILIWGWWMDVFVLPFPPLMKTGGRR